MSYLSLITTWIVSHSLSLLSSFTTGLCFLKSELISIWTSHIINKLRIVSCVHTHVCAYTYCTYVCILYKCMDCIQYLICMCTVQTHCNSCTLTHMCDLPMCRHACGVHAYFRMSCFIVHTYCTYIHIIHNPCIQLVCCVLRTNVSTHILSGPFMSSSLHSILTLYQHMYTVHYCCYFVSQHSYQS